MKLSYLECFGVGLAISAGSYLLVEGLSLVWGISIPATLGVLGLCVLGVVVALLHGGIAD